MYKSTKEIRKELAILINKNKKLCISKKEESLSVDKARKQINIKYGKGWREKDDYKI